MPAPSVVPTPGPAPSPRRGAGLKLEAVDLHWSKRLATAPAPISERWFWATPPAGAVFGWVIGHGWWPTLLYLAAAVLAVMIVVDLAAQQTRKMLRQRRRAVAA